MNMFKYHIIHESVSVSFDTLTCAISRGMIYGIKLYIKMFMYHWIRLCVSWRLPVEKPVENWRIHGIVSYVLDNLIGCCLRQ